MAGVCGCGHDATRFKHDRSGERCCLDCDCTAHEVTPPSSKQHAESFTTKVGITYNVGDNVVVGIDSWGGRGWHLARIERICPKRIKVFWLDSSSRHGTSSYVPKEAIR